MRPPPLPPGARLLACILFTTALVRGYWRPIPPVVPFVDGFIPLLESVGGVPTLQWMVLGGATLFLLGLAPRIGCLLAGASLVAQTIGRMAFFSNGRLFGGLLLLLIGLHRTARGTTALRAQVVVLYIGATLSKVFDVDWWNGQAIEATLQVHPSSHWMLAWPWTQKVAGWVTMLVEGALALLFVSPGARWAACVLCLCFHTWLAVLLREDFSMFFYAVAGSCLLFLENPPEVRVRGPGWLRPLVRYGFYQDATFEVGGPTRLELPDRVREGWLALGALLVLSPVGLLVPVALANKLPPPYYGLRGLVLVVVALALSAAVLVVASPWGRHRLSNEAGEPRPARR